MDFIDTHAFYLIGRKGLLELDGNRAAVRFSRPSGEHHEGSFEEGNNHRYLEYLEQFRGGVQRLEGTTIPISHSLRKDSDNPVLLLHPKDIADGFEIGDRLRLGNSSYKTKKEPHHGHTKLPIRNDILNRVGGVVVYKNRVPETDVIGKQCVRRLQVPNQAPVFDTYLITRYKEHTKNDFQKQEKTSAGA